MNHKICNAYKDIIDGFFNFMNEKFRYLSSDYKESDFKWLITFIKDIWSFLLALSIIVWWSIQGYFLLKFNVLNLFSYSQVFSDTLLLVLVAFVSSLAWLITYLLVFKAMNEYKYIGKHYGYISLISFCIYSYVYNYTNLWHNLLSICLDFTPIILYIIFILKYKYNISLLYNILWYIYMLIFIMIFLLIPHSYFDSLYKIFIYTLIIFLLYWVISYKIWYNKDNVSYILNDLVFFIFFVYFLIKMYFILLNFYWLGSQKIIIYEGVQYKSLYFNDKWILFQDIDSQWNLTWDRYIIPVWNIERMNGN